MLIALLKSETNKGREKCLCLICSKIVLLLVQNGYKTCFHPLWCNSEMHTSMCVYLSPIFEYFRNSVIFLRMVRNINILISLKYICLELRSYNVFELAHIWNHTVVNQTFIHELKSYLNVNSENKVETLYWIEY